MSVTIKLNKGFDLRLKGIAEKKLISEIQSTFYALKPTDFPGLVPRLNVKPGDQVQAGSSLFIDKVQPEIHFTSPVSGTVISINRGDRRKLLEVVIERSGNETIDFGEQDISKLSGEQIKKLLLISGLWPVVRQRPYHIIARPDSKPKSIFITCFDTSPLAPDYNFILENSSLQLFQTGVTALSKLTEGKVHLVLNEKDQAKELQNFPGTEVSLFSGPHPAGNVGVHIHHLDPLNKGEVVWFVNLQDVISIGRLLAEGIYRPERIIALTGSEVISPQYYKVLSGTSVSGIIKDNIKEGYLRTISGNVLTGTKISPDGYLGYYDSQLTIIPEGNHYEFFGWAKPGFDKFSFFRTFASKLFPRKEYILDTNLNGGERAFVLTGQYEKVVPMDIYPMQLFKAILAQDIDMMENLGIYEVAEEDFALCEYIDPSKTEIQTIVRVGLEMMMKEMS